MEFKNHSEKRELDRLENEERGMIAASKKGNAEVQRLKEAQNDKDLEIKASQNRIQMMEKEVE